MCTYSGEIDLIYIYIYIDTHHAGYVKARHDTTWAMGISIYIFTCIMIYHYIDTHHLHRVKYN